MAYGARIDELKKLDQQRPMDGLTSEDMVKAAVIETKVIGDAIDRYATVREVHLNQLLRCMDESNAKDAWSNAVADSRSSMRATLGDALHDVKTPNIAALNVVTTGVDLEDKFHDGLAKCSAVGAAMDAIAVYKKELAQKKEALNTKWGETARRAQEIMRDEQTVLADIQKVMKEAVDAEAERHKNIREEIRTDIKAAADAAKLVGSVLPVPSIVKDALDQLKTAAETWEKMSGDLDARKARYEQYFSNDHTSVLVMFKGSREDARDFLDKHDYVKLVLDWTSKARSSLSDLAGATKTSGQKSDADEFASKATTKLEAVEKEAKTLFDDFVSANKTSFFGAFSPEIDKAIIGSDSLEEAYKNIASVDLAGLLAKWIDDNRRDFREIEASDMPDAWKDDVRKQLMESLNRLAGTEEEIMRNALPDSLMAWLRGKVDALKRILG